jgi:hypothetical protein
MPAVVVRVNRTDEVRREGMMDGHEMPGNGSGEIGDAMRANLFGK